jgi:hypothetical protein
MEVFKNWKSKFKKDILVESEEACRKRFQEIEERLFVLEHPIKLQRGKFYKVTILVPRYGYQPTPDPAQEFELTITDMFIYFHDDGPDRRYCGVNRSGYNMLIDERYLQSYELIKCPQPEVNQDKNIKK